MMAACYCTPGLPCMWHARETGRYWLDADPSVEADEARQRVIHGDGPERSEHVGITRPQG